VTTSTVTDRPRAARRAGAEPERREAPSPSVEALRARSHESLTVLVTALGYPSYWADELERRSFAANRVWSVTPSEAR
jgi:hypothetical protein